MISIVFMTIITTPNTYDNLVCYQYAVFIIEIITLLPLLHY